MVAGAALSALALAMAACGGGDDGGGSGGGTGGGSGPSITIVDFAFNPDSVDVSAGTTTITLVNNGAVEHNFSLDDGSVSQDVDPGETQTVTVDVSATAGFHCKYHPTQMTGTLNVG
jgi:plastocyanin